MDDAITIGNLIPEDIKIGLILNKLPESWGTFTTMNNNIKSLPELLTKICHEDIRRQKKAANQPMAMAASNNRHQQYQPANRQRHKAWKGKALESNKSSNKNDGQRSYTHDTQKSGSFKVTWGIVKGMDIDKVCQFKQVYLNKVRRPQAHNVEIQEVNKDKCEYSSDNKEYQNEEVYI